jgi:glucan phosphoethanolaminetransferase (alkaline phosphatase superfamily)
MYAILIGVLINLVVLPDNNLVPNYLLLLTGLAALLTLIGFTRLNLLVVPEIVRNFIDLMLGVVMVVFPWIAAATTRRRNMRKNGASMPMSIFIGFIGALNLVLFFLFLAQASA